MADQATDTRVLWQEFKRTGDRGLRDRPGALRLVGVGVSGLSEHRQLTFE